MAESALPGDRSIRILHAKYDACMKKTELPLIRNGCHHVARITPITIGIAQARCHVILVKEVLGRQLQLGTLE
jgi:hypothetical protein